MSENIFGGPRTERLKFFSDLHSIASDLTTQSITVEQANKLLMLACGSFHESATDSIDLFMHLKFPKEADVISQLRTFLPSIGITQKKIPMIKKCREITGMGLKEAKEYIEEHFPEV